MIQKDKHRAIVSTASFEHGRALSLECLDTLKQISEANRQTIEIRDLVYKAIMGDETAINLLNQDSNYKRKDPIELHNKLNERVEAQNAVQNSLLERLYTIQQMQEFNDEVLSVLESFEPGLRNRILVAMKEKRLLHSATTWKDKK
jgi:hypothetical protein